MHSAKRLRDITEQAQRERKIARESALDEEFHNILATLPGLAENAARSGQSECRIYAFPARTRSWLNYIPLGRAIASFFGMYIIPREPTARVKIINPLSEYLNREGFNVRVNFNKSLFRGELVAIWK